MMKLPEPNQRVIVETSDKEGLIETQFTAAYLNSSGEWVYDSHLLPEENGDARPIYVEDPDNKVVGWHELPNTTKRKLT